MPGGASWIEARNGLLTEMRKAKIKEWFLINRDGMMFDSQLLCEIIQREDTSFPIVTLGGEYFIDEYGADLKGNPVTWPNHTVIVIKCNPESYHIFDPYDYNGEQHVREIDRNTFECNWICGCPKRGMMWFERKSLTLEAFDEGDVSE
jgi:hypothetical protein